ncbi:hypothetical protein ACOSQ4_005159 [Xanthoceras sorbifolium]
MTTRNQTNAEFRNEVHEILGHYESNIDEVLKGRTVTVLVDGGSTHNFVDQSLVTKYGLPVIHDKTFQVMVTYRKKIDCTGKCLALPLDSQGYQVKADFYILPVAACQLVLGMNYQRLTMTFHDKRTSHTFQDMKQSGLEVLNEKECHHIHDTITTRGSPRLLLC